jgi:excisionase family DNA binding protein
MQLALTIPQAAAALNMSRATIYRRIEDGTIRAVRIGGLIRVPTSELERIVNGD